MKFLKKYLLLAFVIENLLAQTRILGGSSVPFFIFLGIGIIFLFEGSLFRNDVYKSCKCLFALAGVYIIYQFTLGIETISSRTLLYLTAKVATFIIIAISVTSNWDFYAKKTPQIFSIGVLLVLIYGMLTGATDVVEGRMQVGFTNTNTTGTLGAFAFAGFLFFRNPSNKIIYFLSMLLCFFAVMAAGSRNGILLFVIIIFMWHGISMKTIPIVVVLSVLLFIMLEHFEMEIEGINRVVDTLNGEITSNRDEVHEAAYWMISQRPWTGWGFEAKNVGEAAFITEFGSHNGYLETIKFIGYPFAFLWFSILFVGVYGCIKLYKQGVIIKYHLAVVVATIVSAFFEGLFVGVHEIGTNLLFISLTVLTTYKYRQRKINKYAKNHNNLSRI